MIQARAVEGRWRRLRWWADAALIAVLPGIPWLRIAGEPLVWLDIPARKFHVFGLVIVPQELYFLWLLLAALTLALFLVSALLGRLWCGWGGIAAAGPWGSRCIIKQRGDTGFENRGACQVPGVR